MRDWNEGADRRQRRWARWQWGRRYGHNSWQWNLTWYLLVFHFRTVMTVVLVGGCIAAAIMVMANLETSPAPDFSTPVAAPMTAPPMGVPVAIPTPAPGAASAVDTSGVYSLDRDAEVLGWPGGAPIGRTLHAGRKTHVLDREGNWLKVRMHDRTEGWIAADAAEFLEPWDDSTLRNTETKERGHGGSQVYSDCIYWGLPHRGCVRRHRIDT